MTRETDSGLKEAILTLSHLGHSCRNNVNVLKERNLVVSKTTASRVINADAMERAGYPKPAKETKTRGVPKKRTKELLKKVKKDITGANPLSQKQLAMKHGVSKSTINHIIRSDLEGILRRKYRVHGLSNAQVLQRFERGPRFLQYINGNKWKNVITIDELDSYEGTASYLLRI